MTWHKHRFEPRPTAVHVNCESCGRDMWLPACKVAMYRTCGPECMVARRAEIREERRRSCETCQSTFYPRAIQIANGGGRFCSQACNTAAREAMLQPDVIARARATRRQLEAEGKIEHYPGEKNPRWMGGPKASRERQVASGKSAERVRRYRAKHPHRAREWAQNRKNRKHGARLPYGTIPRLGGAQRWKCAICQTSIKARYHVDHIMPIARGGKHEPRNLQLLCPSCNVRKNAKDPIAYMQELGRLL